MPARASEQPAEPFRAFFAYAVGRSRKKSTCLPGSVSSSNQATRSSAARSPHWSGGYSGVSSPRSSPSSSHALTSVSDRMSSPPAPKTHTRSEPRNPRAPKYESAPLWYTNTAP